VVNKENVQDWDKFLLLYQFGVAEVVTKLDILNLDYSRIHDYNPIEHIKSRIKTQQSVVDKLKRLKLPKNIESAKENITDIGGIRIICAFEDDVYYLFETLSRVKDIEVIKVKDYIKEPKPNGYRSFHMIISVPIFLSQGVEYIKIELQIRTILMDFWASLEHKLYYKKGITVPDRITEGLRDCGSIACVLDDKMLSIKKEINSTIEYVSGTHNR